MARSIQEGFLFGSKCVGSELSRERLNELRRFSNSLPSAVVSPSGHQNCAFPLTSEVKNGAYELVKFVWKSKDSGEV